LKRLLGTKTIYKSKFSIGLILSTLWSKGASVLGPKKSFHLGKKRQKNVWKAMVTNWLHLKPNLYNAKL